VARWEPDARGRLLRAALELFAERGYDATTAAQIAERAGLTKTTLFRLFADKREILFQGQPALISVVAAAVEAADEGAEPFAVLRTTVSALCDLHSPDQREIGRSIDLLVASTPELQERTAFKRASITAALEAALAARFGDPHLAGVLADIGMRAYYEGFAAWTRAGPDARLEGVVLNELDALERVLADCRRPFLPQSP
jgi:AcrR family transcriptional regulator